MAVLEASNNGGRYNMVHRQTDDGLVISVAMGKNLTPLVFRYVDWSGCPQETLLSSAFYPHKRLMRSDCGWVEEHDKRDLLFDYIRTDVVIDGFTSGPSGEYDVSWHETHDSGENVRLCGLEGHRTVYRRKDREYWTPNMTLMADKVEDIFGFEQYNPITCPTKQPNKCGIVTWEDKC